MMTSASAAFARRSASSSTARVSSSKPAGISRRMIS
jgi:hypothetical protein